jgi:hypothetical protein
LKALLNTFADSTGLKVNYAKSSMVPINLDEDRLHHLASIFQCEAGSFPFTYLWLLLTSGQPSIHDYMPLVHRMEKRLISTSLFLTQGGKLQLVNSTLSSLPTFYMCAIKMPIDILNQVDKYRRHCLWKGVDMNTRKQSLTAWKMVTRPKSRGGQGVIKLRLQNEALLIKNMDKFFNKVDLPWVHLIWEKYYENDKLPGEQMKGSFWWHSILRLLPTYKGIAQVSFGSGDTILFWADMWNGRVLKHTYLELFSFAAKESVTLKDVLESDSFQSNFHMPPSEEAYRQFCELSIYLQALEINGDKDAWSYIWGSKNYSSAKAYKHLIGSQPVHPAFIWIWRSACQMKHKVFFWLFCRTD